MKIVCEFHINALREEWWGNTCVNIVDTMPTKLSEKCFTYPFHIGAVETPNDKVFSYKIGVYLFTLKGKQMFVDANDILPMSPNGDFETYVSALVDYLNQHEILP